MPTKGKNWNPAFILFLRESGIMAENPPVYPLITEPVLKSKIWGGKKLEELYNYPLSRTAKIGEAWIAADLPEGSCRISNGPYSGRTLSDVVRAWGEYLIGTGWKNPATRGRYPLLVKFLDAQDDLSVQVHPGQDDCQKYFPQEFSKDESWVVLHAEPGAGILYGFQPGTNLETFDRLLAQGKVMDCLRKVEVKAGDVFHIAPGKVHALCKGVVILEIQEPSDTTFRIYDYGRLGEDGRPRQLHLDASRKVMKFDYQEEPRILPETNETSWGEHEILMDIPPYRIERASLNSELQWNVNPATTQTLICLEGNFTLWAAGEPFTIHKGECCVLPASLGSVQLNPLSSHNQIVLAGLGGIPILNHF